MDFSNFENKAYAYLCIMHIYYKKYTAKVSTPQCFLLQLGFFMKFLMKYTEINNIFTFNIIAW